MLSLKAWSGGVQSLPSLLEAVRVKMQLQKNPFELYGWQRTALVHFFEEVL